MSTIAFLILGLIAGSVARVLVPGRIGGGLLSALVCGVVGALVGGWISNAIFGVPLRSFWSLSSWIISIAGSALVLAIWGMIKSRAK